MILVTGATGNVGRCLVDALLERDLPVRALTRRPPDSGLPAEVEVVAGDLSTTAGVAAALDGVDAAFLNPRATPPHWPRRWRSQRWTASCCSPHCAYQTRSDLTEARRLQATKHQLRAVRDDLVVLQPGQFMSNELAPWRRTPHLRWTRSAREDHLRASPTRA